MNHRKGLYVSNCECAECDKYREALALGQNQGYALKARPETNVTAKAKEAGISQ